MSWCVRVCSNEKDLLNIHKHQFVGEEYEKQLLGARYPSGSQHDVDFSKLSAGGLLAK